MNKRGMSPTSLLISIIVGLILVFLVVMLVNQKVQYSVKATTCEGQGNTCVASQADCATIPVQGFECKNATTPICCKG